MNQNEQHAQLIALGPGPYFILIIWGQILGAQAVDVGRLADASAISAPTVRKYLAKLRAFGYALPAAGDRWQLSGNLAQLDFLAQNGVQGELAPVIDIEAQPVDAGEPVDKPVDKSAESVDKIPPDGGVEKKNFFSPIINNSIESLKDSFNPVNTNSGDEKNFFSPDEAPPGGDPPPEETPPDPHQETIQALADYGIRINARTRRLLGRITPADVRQVANSIREDPAHSLKETGWMVSILETRAEKNERTGAGRNYASWEAETA